MHSMKHLKILCFQHVPFEGLDSIANWCDLHGHEVTYTRFFVQETIPPVTDFDWLIIMGGPMGVYDESEFPWLAREKAAIQTAIAHNKTVLGICLGAQLIADVLGAKVSRNPEKEIGWFNISLTEAGKQLPFFKDTSPVFEVFHWHGDTFELPTGAQHLAFSEACTNQAFLYQDRVLGLQFHFEVTDKGVRSMLEHGQEELISAPYIQEENDILSNTSSIPGNNQRMFRILDHLATL